jgi:SAM-dependent methyltransferase
MMGLRRFFTRYWPLMISGAREGAKEIAGDKLLDGMPYHKNLYATCRWYLRGLSTASSQRGSAWTDYTEERSHYTEADSRAKYETVSRWLESVRPEWVIDVGCNTGEFSRLAEKAGANVVAIDYDHQSIQVLYRALASERIYPVFSNLDDIGGGSGWAGNEFPGLVARLRGRADLVLLLAVTHHLAVSSAIPYEEIARLVSELSRKYAIVELIDVEDPMLVRLARQRDRTPGEFSREAQLSAFAQFFQVTDRIKLPSASRELVLMRRLERS